MALSCTAWESPPPSDSALFSRAHPGLHATQARALPLVDGGTVAAPGQFRQLVCPEQLSVVRVQQVVPG